MVKELESRIQQITKEAEATNVIKQQLEQDKVEMQNKLEVLQQDLHRQQSRYD